MKHDSHIIHYIERGVHMNTNYGSAKVYRSDIDEPARRRIIENFNYDAGIIWENYVSSGGNANIFKR